MDNQNLEERLTRLEGRLAKIADRLSYLDDPALEQRLTRIEEMLTKLDYRVLRSYEILDVRALKVELRIDDIDARIKDFIEVERLAYEAYLKSHPDAQSGVEEMNEAVETARRRIFFSKLPTVEDHDRRSKS